MIQEIVNSGEIVLDYGSRQKTLDMLEILGADSKQIIDDLRWYDYYDTNLRISDEPYSHSEEERLEHRNSIINQLNSIIESEPELKDKDIRIKII